MAWPNVAPLIIQFMLVCYYSPTPAEEIGKMWDTSSGRDARRWLIAHHLLDDDYAPTERGKSWVEMICATPLPVQKWCAPE